MRNLLPLNGPAIAHYDSIAAVKHLDTRKLLKQLRPAVAQRYGAYLLAAPCLEQLPASSFSSKESEALKHCYDSETEPLSALKMAIREQQDWVGRAYCAYCGINMCGTIEHYLPKAEFPEYAVCAYNLLPACGDCNTAKGTNWLEEERRRLLHFYYDIIPDGVRWLHAIVELVQDIPIVSFHLEQPKKLDASFYRLVQDHYAALNLLERYALCSVDVLSEALSTAERYSNEPKLLQEALTIMAHSEAKRRGHNHWKVATLFGLASSPDFLERACRGNVLL